MSQHFLSPERRIFFDKGFAAIRILLGLMMAYHGFEIFDSQKMLDYSKMLSDINYPAPTAMAYLGKGAELFAGVCIAAGLFTRVAVWPMILTMLAISFSMGKGRIFYEDQHPFLFVLLGLIFFFYGPGKYSVDQYLYGKR